MKKRYRLVCLSHRGGMFYVFDTESKKRESLGTKDPDAAQRLIDSKNEAVLHVSMNLQIAQVYLQHSDPSLATRTWEDVFVKIISTKSGPTQDRWKCAQKDKAFDLIRHRKVVETTSEQFLTVLQKGTVATNLYLRRTHRFALNMHWLPWPILPAAYWPPLVYKDKRAITFEEHQKLVQREKNPEWKAFYELLWHIGGAQTDIATLTADAIDWKDWTINFHRRKTGTAVHLSFGSEAATVLQGLPKIGPLFPHLATLNASKRAAWFRHKVRAAEIAGITLHSYRYAWAERARSAGYPEQYAMQALGHHSECVHRAYARKAEVKIPALENFEKDLTGRKIVPFPPPSQAVNR